ncbi:piggyBac transposable element-derived protein 3-like [Homalodisca vitripennis]|uniref:piggyBac transposable element-derived protein 3-like n=1 Tax=Homalodisca vitripennis TaxID=197043 RepID=UPI001EEBF5AF|nr:piggyBac transposable element-derived protein 3-like [Homalodisca vitripennis]
MFEKLLTNEIIEYVVESTNIYALQSGNESFNVSIEEMRIFMAILFLSGYCIVPRKRMYWELSPDTHHDTVSKAMSRRNKFEEILRYFHVCDNANLDVSDKFAKIRPLWNMLNERWLQAYPGDANISIDESMVPYFGRHGAKQHIHGKPIRFGYKVWCVCTRLGYLIQAEPYQGKKTGNTIPEIGVGGSVVIDILSELPQNKTYSIYMDNFFTSLKLVDYLSEKGHDATGTIKANRVENAPLKEATVLKKESRGSYDQLTEQKTGITLVRYNDNNVVTVASTRCGVQPMGKAKRWCRVAKRQVDVQQPACIINYNTYMGGVDQLDQNISTYRIGIRNRKWYWALLAYLLNATMNNAWQLYRLTPKGREDPKDLLSFIRHIVQTYFQKYTPQRQRASRVSVTGKERVEESVRLSNSLHVLETNPTQIRCGLCRKNTWKKCKQCLVGCHIKCFENFHS